jgi:hypothetical protein
MLLICGLALAVGVAGSPVLADDTPNPNEVHITGLTYGGSGCPGGSAAVNVSSDAQAFTLIFDEFIAEIGPGVPLPQSRKNCQVNLTLHVPHGFTYGIAAVDYRGFANLARRAKGLQKAIYYFQGQEPTASTWRAFVGPMDNDWQIRDEVEWATIVWAPCGVERSLNINAQIRLDRAGASSSSSSFMTMDSEDGSLTQIYHLVWRRCNN